MVYTEFSGVSPVTMTHRGWSDASSVLGSVWPCPGLILIGKRGTSGIGSRAKDRSLAGLSTPFLCPVCPSGLCEAGFVMSVVDTPASESGRVLISDLMLCGQVI